MKECMQEIKTLEEFETAKQQGGINVFTFSANWCPDCVFIKPFMPKLVEKYSDYHFYYIDRDQLMDAAVELMVMGIPSFVDYQNRGDDTACLFLIKLQNFCLKKQRQRL